MLTYKGFKGSFSPLPILILSIQKDRVKTNLAKKFIKQINNTNPLKPCSALLSSSLLEVF